MLTHVCANCGKEFVPPYGNSRYCCDECAKAAQYRRRKEWEKETDFLSKQRERLRNRRLNPPGRSGTSAGAPPVKPIAPEPDHRPSAEQLHAERMERLAAAAAHGDPMAKMELAIQTGGNLSPAYWEAFAEFCINREHSQRCQTFVNGISVHDSDFVDRVLISIQELNAVKIDSVRVR